MNNKSILEVFGEKSKDADELVSYTLQSIANMPRGESEDVLYKAQTKGGEDRFIYRNIPNFPTHGRRQQDANVLRKLIQDPAFADTLSYQEGMEKLAPRKSILNRLMELIGY
tara:strand:+ start:10695 stop:11030 length:336 start_codon:yes stop_codon:yes gene_type:complete